MGRASIRSLAAALALFAGAASAESVVLTSRTTGFVLKGEIVAFDGSTYVIDTSIGRLTIPAADMDCEGAGCPGEGAAASLDTAFGVIGSNAIGQSLMPALIEAYSYARGGEVEREIGTTPDSAIFHLRDEAGAEIAEINLSAPGSAAAFPSLVTGDALIGMSSRPARAAEVEAVRDAGLGEITASGREHVLALDGLILIVAPDNPLRSVNIVDAGEIFAGKIDNWATLGGPDRAINVYVPDPRSGGAEIFRQRVLDPLGQGFSPKATIVASNRDLADTVAADPYGVGFTSMAFERNARALNVELSCGIIVEPNEFTVKAEEYPLARRLFLYTTDRPLPEAAQGFLDFALSDDAQSEIADSGFVSQSIASLSLNRQGRRIAEAFIQPRDADAMRMMRDMALELLDADRLSTTFRFAPNAVDLDNKSLGDVGRLARHAASGAFEGKEIVLIGFADDEGGFEEDLALSDKRAAAIRDALAAELAGVGAGADILTLGFGSLAPIACGGEQGFGGASNRRVEVWIRDRL